MAEEPEAKQKRGPHVGPWCWGSWGAGALCVEHWASVGGHLPSGGHPPGQAYHPLFVRYTPINVVAHHQSARHATL